MHGEKEIDKVCFDSGMNEFVVYISARARSSGRVGAICIETRV